MMGKYFDFEVMILEDGQETFYYKFYFAVEYS